jgi:quinol monooxygenase YgiN
MAVHLSGQLICASQAEAKIVADHLPEHIRLTRLEPGCEMFDVTQSADPLVWNVAERFTTRADFDAHQTRTRASRWGAKSAGIARHFTVTES